MGGPGERYIIFFALALQPLSCTRVVCILEKKKKKTFWPKNRDSVECSLAESGNDGIAVI